MGHKKQPTREPHRQSQNSPRFGEVLAAYRRELGQTHQRSLHLLHGHKVARFTRAFGREQLGDITGERIAEYVLGRETAGADAETVNDELRALAWVLSWAHERGLLATVPRIGFLREARRPGSRPFRDVWGRRPAQISSGQSAATASPRPPAPPGPRPKVDAETYLRFKREHPNAKDPVLARLMNHALGRTDITRRDVLRARHRAARPRQ